MNKIFVRMDERIEGTVLGPTDFDDHVNYLKEICDSRLFLGGASY